MVDYASRNDERRSTLTPRSPTEMLKHLVLRILVFNHRRNTKLLEFLQGAIVLNGWAVHMSVLNLLSSLIPADKPKVSYQVDLVSSTDYRN